MCIVYMHEVSTTVNVHFGSQCSHRMIRLNKFVIAPKIVLFSIFFSFYIFSSFFLNVFTTFYFHAAFQYFHTSTYLDVWLVFCTHVKKYKFGGGGISCYNHIHYYPLFVRKYTDCLPAKKKFYDFYACLVETMFCIVVTAVQGLKI